MRLRVFLLALALCPALGLARAAPAGPQPVAVLLPGDGPGATLLGVWNSGRWSSGPAAARLLRGGEPYRVQGLTGAATSARGTRPKSFDEPCPDTFGLTLTPRPPAAPGFLVATSAALGARPRSVRVTTTRDPVYLAAVRDQLVRRGLRSPEVEAVRVTRVDLDGNGTDEVFVEAGRFKGGQSNLYPPPSGEPGDYSVLLLRQLVGGRVRTSVLGAYVVTKPSASDSGEPPPLATLYALAGIADLNGDGRLEVLTFNAYYEGYTVTASEWTPGGGLKERLEAGCGA